MSLEMPFFLDESSQPVSSEWPVLTELLTCHKSLKLFRPFTIIAHELTFGCPGPVQFDLGSDTKLPAFEDFTIPFNYQADQMHVSLLLRAMSWSSLRRLELGSGPGFLIQAITGHVPQLKSLVVNLLLSDYRQEIYSTIATLIPFIKSIDYLEEVSVKNSAYEDCMAVWLAIFTSQGSTLRKVKVDSHLTIEMIDIMATKTTGLEKVTISLARVIEWGSRFTSTSTWASTHSSLWYN